MRSLLALSTLAALLAGCSNAPPPAPVAETHGIGSIIRLDPAFDSLVSKDAVIEKVAGGFSFTEGPLWRPDGVLWFSDVTGNVVRSVTPSGQVTVLIPKAGGESSAPPGSFIGPNGMISDKDGYVLLCQHTNRRIVRVAKDLTVTGYLEKFEGKRFNSPNDLVYRSDGTLYFTDPPYGLLKQDDDPAKELKFNGVFRYANGKLTALIKDLSRPNGLAFSPDEKTLYVANSDEKKRIWMRYDVAPDGTVSNGKVFADVTADKELGLPDGFKVDSQGNIWTSGPAGIWVFAPDGKHLGTLKMPEVPANCNWGDDGKTLYITAVTGVYRIKTSVMGEKPLYQVYQ
ncbi:MAG TPA: SMP-30/gluconolactonase/LRE family protein [Bryobacteraceae bacterium]|nr:SMP-30/gluconolactonase/LRE family protein [Bryobacteraceae bacterium]